MTHNCSYIVLLMCHEGMKRKSASLRNTAVSKRLSSDSSGSVCLYASVVITQGTTVFKRNENQCSLLNNLLPKLYFIISRCDACKTCIEATCHTYSIYQTLVCSTRWTGSGKLKWSNLTLKGLDWLINRKWISQHFR